MEIDKIIYSTKTNTILTVTEELPKLKITSGYNLTEYHLDDSLALHFKELLSSETCDDLIKHYTNLSQKYSINSYNKRLKCFDISFAEKMWNLLGSKLKIRNLTDFASTDHWYDSESTNWEPVAISPLVRFIQYEKGEEEYAHYDNAFVYPNNEYRTLMSGLLFLTTNETCVTRFIEDSQSDVPTSCREFEKWRDEAEEEQILYKFKPKKGSLLLFDHKICHDVEIFNGEEENKIIIRFDVVFKEK